MDLLINDKGNQHGHGTYSTVEKEYGTVYYWDLVTGASYTLGKPIPTDQSFNMSLKLKIAKSLNIRTAYRLIPLNG